MCAITGFAAREGRPARWDAADPSSRLPSCSASRRNGHRASHAAFSSYEVVGPFESHEGRTGQVDGLVHKLQPCLPSAAV
eukprot:6036566-Pleurochrysis_carterae.AAC.1